MTTRAHAPTASSASHADPRRRPARRARAARLDPTPLRRSFALREAQRVAEARVLAAHRLVQGARRPLTTWASLTAEERSRGVVAASAGNHALGVAFAAAALGGDTQVTLFVPETAPRAKVEKLRTFPVTVREGGRTYDDAYAASRAFEKETGATYVHAFDDPRTAAGQGTCGLEILAQCPDVGTILVPVGGGGLIAGIAVAAKALRPDVRIVGVQPAASPSLSESLRARPAPPRVRRRADPGRRHRGRHRPHRLGAPAPHRRGRRRAGGRDRATPWWPSWPRTRCWPRLRAPWAWRRCAPVRPRPGRPGRGPAPGGGRDLRRPTSTRASCPACSRPGPEAGCAPDRPQDRGFARWIAGALVRREPARGRPAGGCPGGLPALCSAALPPGPPSRSSAAAPRGDAPSWPPPFPRPGAAFLLEELRPLRAAARVAAPALRGRPAASSCSRTASPASGSRSPTSCGSWWPPRR